MTRSQISSRKTLGSGEIDDYAIFGSARSATRPSHTVNVEYSDLTPQFSNLATPRKKSREEEIFTTRSRARWSYVRATGSPRSTPRIGWTSS